MNNERFIVVKDDIVKYLTSLLERSGMYYRIFARSKSDESIIKKLREKEDSYKRDNKKMQDLIGVRIAFYFQEDVLIFHNKLKSIAGYDAHNESNSYNELCELDDLIMTMPEVDNVQVKLKNRLKKLVPLEDKVFMPERLNVVMNMSDVQIQLLESELEAISSFDPSLIDFTYEVQLRTIFSEGWHEVEHDLRYKTINEPWWSYCKDESRMLNGLYASLVTSEGTLSQMIDEITYKNFKHKNWDAMIRFHFRRRTLGQTLSKKLCVILDKDDRIAKDILHVSREELSNWLWEIQTNIPITTDLLLFIVNRKVLKLEKIKVLEPDPIKKAIDYVNIS